MAERLGALEVVDQELTVLDLNRSVMKTSHFDDFASAMAEVEDGMLASLFESGGERQGRGFSDRVHARFSEFIVEADEVEPRHYRALFRTLQNRRDPFATPFLITDTSLLNIDPIIVGDYLSSVVPTVAQGEAFIDLLSRTTPQERDRYDARDLHLLRALSGRTWGAAEGRVFWEIAMDDTRRGAVRAWAVIAAARTPQWARQDVLERVLEEIEPSVRRSLVLSLYRSRDDMHVRRLFRHIRRSVPDLIPPAEWVEVGRRPPWRRP